MWGPAERVWGSWGLNRCGCFRCEWARYFVSVGVECVYMKGSLVLVLVLDWTPTGNMRSASHAVRTHG